MRFHAFLLLIMILASCQPSQPDSSRESGTEPQYPVSSQGLSTSQLVNAYCGACHQTPEPAELDKSTWKQVLPYMGYRLGIKTDSIDPMKGLSFAEQYNILKANTYPEQPVLDDAAWTRIVDHYVSQAPENSLPQDQKSSFEPLDSHFRIKEVDYDRAYPGLITYVGYDSARSEILVGDRSGWVARLNNDFDQLKKGRINSPLAFARANGDQDWLALTMGIMDPNDRTLGTLLNIGPQLTMDTLLSGLRRPVHFEVADLDGDSLDDLVICSFGNYFGDLSWYKQLSPGNFEKNILKQVPGSIRAYVHDLNHDQLPDIVALFGQGDEGIFAYLNQGQGQFKEVRLLQFSPLFGSSYFELADLNDDGWTDIVYTNGDNADYSYTMKNYHGIRVFQNNGKNEFDQAYFYPLNGAYGAKTRDFDLDGDLDIAAISFFPDYAADSVESFVLLENLGQWEFQPRSDPGINQGKWLVMDSGDLDQDGDQDLILGSFIFSVTPVPDSIYQSWNRDYLSLLFLENLAL